MNYFSFFANGGLIWIIPVEFAVWGGGVRTGPGA